MNNSTLMAISPLDGRYHAKIDNLRSIFSEYGLMKYRVIAEIRWLETLADCGKISEIPKMSNAAKKILENIIKNFSIKDAEKIKKIEAKINHDVKAVEYFIKDCIKENKELAAIGEFIHFGCTSEDINNLAYGMMLVTAKKDVILPSLGSVLKLLKDFAHKYANLPMMARTHGQPATPTTVGKEIANVVARLNRQIDSLKKSQILGKMNGATGNYNAFAITYPGIKWQAISKKFVNQLGLEWNPYTTQIEPHDCIAELFSILLRINTILIDFNRDTWGYISINYFKQKAVANEVGSSTMPHKINPIDFENAEGNLGIANALLEHMIVKLPISRWQRDLSDSTVLRNMGVALGHAVLAWQSTEKGLSKLEPNKDIITADLNNHWEILAEAIQTIMRSHQLEQPYEQLKKFTRGKHVTQENLHEFIKSLKIPDAVKKKLLALSPGDYTGYAEELAKQI